MNKGRKVLGILGGMGPLATSYFFAKVVEVSDAECDSDHVEVILHSNTRIPDRTRAILHGGESPVNELVRSARLLEEAGADLIVMPCVTAHRFHGEVSACVGVPVLDMVKEAAIEARGLAPCIERVGVLATSGTLSTGLFQAALMEQGLHAVAPDPRLQESLVMEAIYGERGIKAGHPRGHARKLLIEAVERLVGHGAEAVLAGCTEIPLSIGKEDFAVPFIEPMEIAAILAVKRCAGAAFIR